MRSITFFASIFCCIYLWYADEKIIENSQSISKEELTQAQLSITSTWSESLILKWEVNIEKKKVIPIKNESQNQKEQEQIKQKIAESDARIEKNIESNNEWIKQSNLNAEWTQQAEEWNNSEKEKGETIKELKTTITDLQEDKKEVATEFKQFIEKNGTLKGFFKKDLWNKEHEVIWNIVDWYNGRIKVLNDKLKEAALEESGKNKILADLMKAKRNMYKEFAPYIEVSLIDKYNAFIEQDATLSKKEEVIKTDLIEKKEQLDEKVSVIKEKIKKNNVTIQKKLDNVVAERVRWKLNGYIESSKFQGLPVTQKRLIFSKVIILLDKRRESILISNEEAPVIQRKIYVYNIMKVVLNEYISSF